MDKVVILLSGGIDSSTLLYEEVSKGNDCFPLFINYGQRHSKEVIAARNICESISETMLIRLKGVDLSILKDLLPSALTGIGEIPEGYYTDPSMAQTVVPNRNMILLSIAAGYAQGIKAGFVKYAAHAGDHPIYPDCRPEFVERCKETIYLGTGSEVRLEAPYNLLSKADIVRLGTKLRVPYALTWSCYQGREKQCGGCGTCSEVKEAFKLNGIINPIKYEEN